MVQKSKSSKKTISKDKKALSNKVVKNDSAVKADTKKAVVAKKVETPKKAFKNKTENLVETTKVIKKETPEPVKEVKKEEVKAAKAKGSQIIKSNILLLVITGFAIIAIVSSILAWTFWVPESYRLETVVQRARKGTLFVRGEDLVADDNFNVAVIEPCDIAVKYNKKLQADFSIAADGQFGVYQKAIDNMFENKNITLYELRLTNQESQNGETTIVACLDGDKEKDITNSEVEAVIKSLEGQAEEGLEFLDQKEENIPVFNEPSKKVIGAEFFRGIRLNIPASSEQGQEIPEANIYNSFIGVENKLVFVAQQNSRDSEIVAQIDSLNPSEATYNTKDKTNEFLNLKNENKQKLDNEAKELSLNEKSEWKFEIKLSNFDAINLTAKNEYAPRTVENFVRLSFRKYYDDTVIHRITKRDNFNLIQGGDKENGNGTGGQTAFYLSEDYKNLLLDEVWEVAPEFGPNQEGETVAINEPVFRAPDLYKDFDNKTGVVTYKKGTIAMAKSSQPNSASSQFFLMLTDTQLPADYTSFGIVDEEDMGILDEIFAKTNPEINTEQAPGVPQDQLTEDGKPNPGIKIEYIKIL
jgi:cyclophilin family peptidyl-prolyl cis-trans isomerase